LWSETLHKEAAALSDTWGDQTFQKKNSKAHDENPAVVRKFGGAVLAT